MASKKLLIYAVLLVPLLAQPECALSEPADQAVKSLQELRTASECCLTGPAFMQAYEQAEEQVNGFLTSKQAQTRPALAGAISEVWRHYGNAALIYGRQRKGLICQKATLAWIISEYPAADRDFDHCGAVLRDPAGRRCLAPPLLVPLIFRRAAKELDQAQEIFLKGQ